MKRLDYLDNVAPEPIEETVELKSAEVTPDTEWERWSSGAQANVERASNSLTSTPIYIGEERVGYIPDYTPQDVGPQTASEVTAQEGPQPAPENSYWNMPMEAVPMAEGPMIEERIRSMIGECREPARRRILYRVLAELVDLEIPSSPPSSGGISDAEF